VPKKIKSVSKTRNKPRLTCDAQPSFQHPTKTSGPKSWKEKKSNLLLIRIRSARPPKEGKMEKQIELSGPGGDGV
jgi:hypothetical protein